MALIKFEDEAGKERRKEIALEALKAAGGRRVFAPAEEVPAPTASVAPPEEHAKARFDRNAYQRAYMKTYMQTYRARKKLQLNV